MAASPPEMKVKLAAQWHVEGVSYRGICEKLKESFDTSYTIGALTKWSKTDIWKDEVARLKAKSEAFRNESFEKTLSEIEKAESVLRKMILNNLRSDLELQIEVGKAIKNVKISDKPITSISDVAALSKIKSDIHRSTLQSFELLAQVSRLHEFMADNTAIDIEFEEYEAGELPQYDAPDD